MPLELPAVKAALVAFWAAWTTIVLVTNLIELLRALRVLPARAPLSSGNLDAIARALPGSPRPALLHLLLAGVVAWQATAAGLLWPAAAALLHGAPDSGARAATALLVSLGLFAAFMLADELLRAYQQQTMHALVLTGQLVTLLIVIR